MKEPKIIGVIPARYKSTRFPGKPLENICEKSIQISLRNAVGVLSRSVFTK